MYGTLYLVPGMCYVLWGFVQTQNTRCGHGRTVQESRGRRAEQQRVFTPHAFDGAIHYFIISAFSAVGVHTTMTTGGRRGVDTFYVYECVYVSL